MILSRSVIFLRLLLPRNLAVCTIFRTVFSKRSEIVVKNVNKYSKLSPWCYKDIVFAIEMAPRKAAKAAKVVKVGDGQAEELPKNGNKDSDVEEAVVDPVEAKKTRMAGKKVKAAVKTKDDELGNDVEEKKTSRGKKKEVDSQNGNGIPKEDDAEMDEREEEEEEEKLKKPKRAARKAKGKVEERKPTNKRGRGKTVEDGDENEEEDEEEQPAPKRGTKTKAASLKKLPKKGVKSRREDEEEKTKESDDDSAEKEEKQEEQPKKGRNAKAGKTSKEEEKGEESDHSAEMKEEIIEEQPATKRGRKAKATSSKKSVKEAPKEEDVEDGEESDNSSETVKKAPAKRGTKRGATTKKDDGNEKAGPSKKAKANPTVTDWDNITFECTRENSLGKKSNFRITSWNVDGLRAWVNKGGLDIIQKADPDILCLQETKCSVEKLPEEIQNVAGYKMYWCASDKEGYAGVGILTKMMPIDVFYGIENNEQDVDGRCITAEFKKFYLVNVYVPNAGRKLVTLPKRLEWNEAFKTYVKKLDEKKPVIICGDLNVAHSEIDLANPKTNKKNAGFTQEERDGMTDFLNAGFVDTFRKLYPDQEEAYTFWTYMMNARAKNTGWRLDYFLLSERFVKGMCDNVIHSKVLGSDHCPLTLYMNV